MVSNAGPLFTFLPKRSNIFNFWPSAWLIASGARKATPMASHLHKHAVHLPSLRWLIFKDLGWRFAAVRFKVATGLLFPTTGEYEGKKDRLSALYISLWFAFESKCLMWKSVPFQDFEARHKGLTLCWIVWVHAGVLEQKFSFIFKQQILLPQNEIHTIQVLQGVSPSPLLLLGTG